MLLQLLNLAGAVALLVWGTYMVKSGILRTFGDSLRAWLAVHLSNRLAGFSAGFGLAALLQSSTASALLVAGLQAGGLVTTAVGLAAVLGADVGSAVMVRVLTLDLSLLPPLFILAGTVLFVRRPRERSGQFGRILLGLAFILMALSMIVGVTGPLRAGGGLSPLLALLNTHPALGAPIGILLALGFFSSLAVVATAAAFATAGLLPPEAGLWLVLGANLGSALLALLSTAGGSRTARRAPLGNALFRSAGFLVGAILLALGPMIVAPLIALPGGLVTFHIVFNLTIGCFGLLLLAPVARAIDQFLPDTPVPSDEEVNILAPENLLSTTSSLRLARREVLHSAEILERHWKDLSYLIATNPPEGELLVLERRRKLLERRSRAISLYLAAVAELGLTVQTAREWNRLNLLSEELALAAEVTRRLQKTLVEGKCRDNRFFSPSGVIELECMFKDVGTVLSGLVTLIRHPPAGDPDSKHQKETLLAREHEDDREAVERVLLHMQRVSSGLAEAVETSALHVELLGLGRRMTSVLLRAIAAC